MIKVPSISGLDSLKNSRHKTNISKLPKIGAVPRLPLMSNNKNYKKSQTDYQKVTGIWDPNDPLSMNSIADAMFNQAGKEARYGDIARITKWMPVGHQLMSSIAAVDTAIVQPLANLFTGNFKALGINALTNLSETMDILSNPIKSLITPLVNQDTSDDKYSGNIFERVASGFGFSQDGRYNYDYDTGSWVADLGLEFLSDPLNILSIGGSTAASIASKSTAKSVSEATDTLGDIAVKAGAKAVTKTGAEASSELLSKTITKRATKTLVKKVFALKKSGNTISQQVKQLASQTDDLVLKELAKNLDTALSTTKSITNDTITGIIEEINLHIVSTVKNNKISKPALDTVTELLKSTEDFLKTSNLSLADLVLESKGLKFGLQARTAIYSKEAKSLNKELKLALKAKNLEKANLLRDQLKLVLSDPHSVVKYGKALSLTDDSVELLKKVDLTDYLDGAASLLDKSKSFKFMKAMDSLVEKTEAIDGLIFKTAVLSNPVSTGLYAAFKLGKEHLGPYLTRYLMKTLEGVHDYFTKNKMIPSNLFEYNAEIAALDRQALISKHIADTKIEGDFSDSIKKYVYDDTSAWLLGKKPGYFYAPTELEEGDEVQKAVNIIALSEPEQQKHIWFAYGEELKEAGITEDQALDYFYKQFNDLSADVSANNEFKNWNISETAEALKVQPYDIARNALYADFNKSLSGSKITSSKSAFIKYKTGVKPKLAQGLNTKLTKEFVDFAGVDYEPVSLIVYFEEDLKSFEIWPSWYTEHIAESLESCVNINKQLNELCAKYDLLKNSKAPIEELEATELLISDAVDSMRAQVTLVRRNLSSIKDKSDFKKTKFSKVYKAMESFLSPYAGESKVFAKESEVLFNLKYNPIQETIDLLENQDFIDFVESLRNNDLRAALDIYEKELISFRPEELKELGVNFAKFSLDKKVIDDFIANVDSLNFHLATLTQSNIPEVIKNLYLESLYEMDSISSVQFIKNFDTNFNKLISNINNKLEESVKSHNYNLEYYATEMLFTKEYSKTAKAYMNSNKDALSSAKFTKELFEKDILPEYSKTRLVELPGTGETKQIEELVHREFSKYKDSKFVYVSFETTGDNPYLDSIYDFGVYSPEDSLKWGYTQFNFDPELASKKANIQLQSKSKNIEKYSKNNEVKGLLSFYRTCKKITDSGKRITFVQHNSDNYNLDFLKTRIINALEEAAETEDIKTYRKLVEMQEWLENDVYSSSINDMTILKRFEGVPTVGEDYYNLKRLLFAYAQRQSNIHSDLVFKLNPEMLNSFERIASEINYKNYTSLSENISKIITDAKTKQQAALAKGPEYFLSGDSLISESLFNPNTSTVYKYNSHDLLSKQNSIHIDDTKELLNLNEEGRWVYKDIVLPADIDNSNSAVKYLKSIGITYAPKWQALNIKQQSSVFPVLINGKVSLQIIEGNRPLAFSKYIDTDIVHQYFDYSKASYTEQHDYTDLALEMNRTISNITNPKLILEYQDQINEVYDYFIIKQNKNIHKLNIYSYFKSDLDVFHKYAVLVAVTNDFRKGSPYRSLRRFLQGKQAPITPKTLRHDKFYYINYKKFEKLKGEAPKYDSEKFKFLPYPSYTKDPEHYHETMEQVARKLGFKNAPHLDKVEDTRAYKKLYAKNLKRYGPEIKAEDSNNGYLKIPKKADYKNKKDYDEAIAEVSEKLGVPYPTTEFIENTPEFYRFLEDYGYPPIDDPNEYKSKLFKGKPTHKEYPILDDYWLALDEYATTLKKANPDSRKVFAKIKDEFGNPYGPRPSLNTEAFRELNKKYKGTPAYSKIIEKTAKDIKAQQIIWDKNFNDWLQLKITYPRKGTPDVFEYYENIRKRLNSDIKKNYYKNYYAKSKKWKAKYKRVIGKLKNNYYYKFTQALKNYNLRIRAWRSSIGQLKKQQYESYNHFKNLIYKGIAEHNNKARIAYEELTKYKQERAEWVAKQSAKFEKKKNAVIEFNKQATDEYFAALRGDPNNDILKGLSKLIYSPESTVFNKSKFYRVFGNSIHPYSTGYSNNIMGKEALINKIYSSENRGTVQYARQLKEAILEARADVLRTTESFKTAIDKPGSEIYAPSLMRHANLGYSLIDFNDTYLHVVNNLREGPELDTFVAADRQVINNIEDMTLSNVLKLSTEDLTSFVYYQGKGAVVIPVESYIKDKTPHSFDITPQVIEFTKKYSSYSDELITAYKKDGNLIICANNYLANLKSGKINRIDLESVDIGLAFDRAFGVQNSEIIQDIYANMLKAKHIKNPIAKNTTIKESQSFLTKSSSKQTLFYYSHKEDLDNLKKAYIEQFNNLHLLSQDIDSKADYFTGGYGRTLDYEGMQELYQYLPDEAKMNMLGDLDINTVRKVYDAHSENIYNFSALGRAEYRIPYNHFATSNYQAVMGDTYRNTMYNLQTVTQYLSFYYQDSPFTIKNFFDNNYNTEELYVAMKANNDYAVSYCGVDKKGMPKVYEITINSPKDIEYAIEHNASFIPRTVYSSVVQSVNSKRWSSSKLKLFHKINYNLKMFMLVLNPGFLFRNLVDSTIKNYLVTKDPMSMSASYIDAFRYYQQYNDMLDMLFAIDANHPFRPETLDIVFADSTAIMDRETFMLIHNFLESGPSAGSSGKMSKFYLDKAKKSGKLETSFVQKAYDVLLEPTKGIEQITRLAAYIDLIKKGMTNSDAFRIITKTHFDYSMKTGAERLIELIIPFFSFQAKNFEFWLDFASKNPMLSSMIMQMFSSQWNFSEIDFDRIQYYQSQLDNMLTGNLMLNDAGLTLKLSPSVMDPVSIMLNPFESLTGRVSPIWNPIMEAAQGNESYGLPQKVATGIGAVGAAFGSTSIPGAVLGTGAQVYNRYSSGIKAYNRTGSVLSLISPSVFGSVPRNGRASYNNSRTFMDASKRVPRRVNIYNKYYTDSGKNRWKIRFYPIDAATIQYRIRDNYNRFR